MIRHMAGNRKQHEKTEGQLLLLMNEYIFIIVAKKLILDTIPAHLEHGFFELIGDLQLVVGTMFDQSPLHRRAQRAYPGSIVLLDELFLFPAFDQFAPGQSRSFVAFLVSSEIKRMETLFNKDLLIEMLNGITQHIHPNGMESHFERGSRIVSQQSNCWYNGRCICRTILRAILPYWRNRCHRYRWQNRPFLAIMLLVDACQPLFLHQGQGSGIYLSYFSFVFRFHGTKINEYLFS